MGGKVTVLAFFVIFFQQVFVNLCSDVRCQVFREDVLS